MHVYGVLNDDNGTIALVSPVFEATSAKSPTGMIAGTTHGDSGWIFYEG